MRLAKLIAALALVAQPALADPASDYATLRQALPTILFARGGAENLALQAQVLQQIEGRWTNITPLMPDGVNFPADELIAKTCERLGYDLVKVGHFGLTLTLKTKGQPFVVSLRYAGGATYIATFDEAGLFDRLFPGKPLEEMDLDMVYSTLVKNVWQGYITVLPVGKDLLLLQPLGAAPELMARCP